MGDQFYHAGKAILAAVVLLLSVGETAAAGEGQSQDKEKKLLLGFERNEMQAKKGKACLEFLQRDAGHECWAPFEFGVGDRAWTWTCLPGQVTEGRHALVAHIGPQQPLKNPAHVRTEWLSRYYPSVHGGIEAGVILTTFQWLPHAPPEWRDWSGYGLLRADVRLEEQPGKLWLAVEDEILEYRQIPALVVQPYAPPNFVPVAWSNGDNVWLVKVPAAVQKE